MIRKELHKSHTDSYITKALDHKVMDFTFNLEVLRGCKHMCDGCFVNRVNKVSESELDMALSLATQFSDMGMRFKECVISPTDLFSAANTLDILKNPKFQALFQLHSYTNLTSTAYFEKLNIEDIERVFEIIDDQNKFRSDMHIEFFVPLNAQKILDEDAEYEDNHFHILEWMHLNTPRLIDWSFATNIYNDPVLINNYAQITKLVTNKYDTIIEFLPSFFRTNDHNLIVDSLKTWADFSAKAITAENRSTILFTVSDLYHAGSNQFTLNFKDDNIYISPFIYEQILYENDMMMVDSNTVEGVMNRVTSLQTQQYEYASKTKECSDCQFLATCVGRNVLNVMEHEGMVDCLYHRPTLDLFGRFNAA